MHPPVAMPAKTSTKPGTGGVEVRLPDDPGLQGRGRQAHERRFQRSSGKNIAASGLCSPTSPEVITQSK